ncbi:2477_t:CDS:1 [Ambispora gerdemannii]|uniref:2477_t:CDS:1 n=1 Tax=Ambispora gerdemannii TaxID=144530 RepID=A0A9N9CJN5_9GLOM|nr:2477_t:CDS:1 [Ambispora gerdemannii]
MSYATSNETFGINSLPSEVLRKIFQSFHKDPKTLKKFLKVNRQWCREAAPLLWSDPFQFIRKTKNEYKFIETCISCLDPDAQQNLRDFGIEMMPEYPYHSAFFDYLNLIEVFDYQCFAETIFDYVSRNSDKNSDDINQHTSEDTDDETCVSRNTDNTSDAEEYLEDETSDEEVHKDSTKINLENEQSNNVELRFEYEIRNQIAIHIFSHLGQYKNLKEIRFNLEEPYDDEILPDFSIIPKASKTLSSLSTVSIKIHFGHLFPENRVRIACLISMVANHCQKLHTLEIDFRFFDHQMTDDVYEILSRQTQLKKIRLYHIPEEIVFDFACLNSEVVQLDEITIGGTAGENFCFDGLTNYKVRHLQLEEFVGIGSIDYIHILGLQLKSFSISKYLETHLNCSTLLEKIGPGLSELMLNTKLDKQVLLTIGYHCRNLTSLQILIVEGSTPEMIQLFSKLLNLRYLDVAFYSSQSNNWDQEFTIVYEDEIFCCPVESDPDQVLIELAPFLPTTLKDLTLKFRINARSLEVFLTDIPASLHRLHIAQRAGVTDEHIKTIIQYAKNVRTLRELEFNQVFKLDPENLAEAKTLFDISINLPKDKDFDFF